MNITSRLFSKDSVNSGRQLEFDLVKAITIILMIWTHVYEQHSVDMSGSISWVNAYVRGGMYGAVTFMICMGIGMVYTRHQSIHDFFSRGVGLLTTGFTLLIFRGILPVLTLCCLGYAPKYIHYFPLAIGNDILQFAGLAYLLTGLLKKLKLGANSIFGISVLMCIGAQYLRGVETGFYPIDQILGHFWGTNTESYFPLFHWYVTVGFGLWFGTLYKHLNDKDLFHKIALPLGLAVTALYVYVLTCVDHPFFHLLDSERMFAQRRFVDFLVCCLANVPLFSLFYFIGKYLKPESIPTLIYPSKHINQFYCTSWVLITWSTIPLQFIDITMNTDLKVIIMWIIILVLTTFSVILYTKRIKEHTDAFFGRHSTFWTVFVWAVCISVAIIGFCCTDTYANFLNDYLG